VYLLGFAPGFAYLGELDPSLELPRRQSPRTRVPPGSVAIAGLQTAVYPLATPGGWHLIGTTSLRLFDPASEPPALLRVGDRVRFVPVAVP
jgi:KipI family sensor histidine kinase inhibitor